MANTKTVIGVVVAIVAVLAVAAVAVGPGMVKDTNDYVYYHGNGGSLDGSDSKIKSTEVNVMTCPFQRQGYTFTSYNTKQDNTGVRVDPGETVRMGTHLYAQWSNDTTRMTFQENTFSKYVSVSVDGKDVNKGGTVDVAQTFTLTVTAQSGYSFIKYRDYIIDVYDNAKMDACWFTVDCSMMGVKISQPEISADGKTAAYTVSGVGVGQLGSVSYGNSKAGISDNYYSGNGGNTGDGKSVYRASKDTTAPDGQTVFTDHPEGKTWRCWNTVADGSGTTYNAGDTIPVGMRVYAVWA